MVMLSVLNNPALTLQLGILGLGLMGRIVKRCVREVSLAQVSCIVMYVYVAPSTPVGAWSMAFGLRERFEYYYYCALVPYASCTLVENTPSEHYASSGNSTRIPARALNGVLHNNVRTCTKL